VCLANDCQVPCRAQPYAEPYVLHATSCFFCFCLLLFAARMGVEVLYTNESRWHPMQSLAKQCVVVWPLESSDSVRGWVRTNGCCAGVFLSLPPPPYAYAIPLIPNGLAWDLVLYSYVARLICGWSCHTHMSIGHCVCLSKSVCVVESCAVLSLGPLAHSTLGCVVDSFAVLSSPQ